MTNDCDSKAQASASLTFNFTTPIPVNATDLYLQVVYRGPLGSEQDAVVVATKDIPEPTYFSIVNVSDYVVCYNGAWYYKDSSGNLPPPPTIPAMVDGMLAESLYAPSNYGYWRVAFEPNTDFTNGPIAQVNDIAPKEYARIAVLLEAGRKYNDEILGFRAPAPPPYTLVNTGLQQIDYAADGSGTALALDYKLGTFRKVKATIPLFGYRFNAQGTGTCIGVPTPAEPGYPPYTKPTVMKPLTTLNF